MEKILLGLHYNDQFKARYDKIIADLQIEGWVLITTFIDHKAGKGKYAYTSQLTRKV